MNNKICYLCFFALIFFSSCVTDKPKPTWWKYHNNIRNWGQAQDNVVTGKIQFPVHAGGGDLVGCPVMWQDNDEARVVAGFGNAGLTAFVTLNGDQIDHYSSFTIKTCPAVPMNGEGPAAIFGSTVDGVAFSITYGFKENWRHVFDDQGSVLVSSPTVWDNIVFVTAGTAFYALDAGTGDPIWSQLMNRDNIYSNYMTSAVIDPDIEPTVCVGDDQGRVFKFKVARDKVPVWTSDALGGRISGHLMIDGHHNIYVPIDDGSIRILDGASGHEVGRFESFEPGGMTGATLSFDGRSFYVLNSQGTLFEVDIATRKYRWFQKTGLPPTTPIIVTPNNTLWFGIGHGAADAALVSYSATGAVFPAITGFNDVVRNIAAGTKGELYVASGRDLFFIK
jgi:outer membrane protein assembly factor BamB